MVREPFLWKLNRAEPQSPDTIFQRIRRATAGPIASGWHPPAWLLPHQIPAAIRIAGSLREFNGAFLSDAVGLGKTYVALSVASRYATRTVLAPAVLRSQWKSVAQSVGVPITIQSHEALSHGAHLTPSALVVIDEAHRLRNAATRRYDRLARDLQGAAVLCVTATPVVNHLQDLANLLRLFLSDGALGFLGVPSIQESAAGRRGTLLQKAVAPLIVARSSRTINAPDNALPAVNDHAVILKSTLPPGQLEHVLAGIDALDFPTFGTSSERTLLRHHLLYRLASSPAAYSESLHRHLIYLDRAIIAGRSGERLKRGESRRLFGSRDDLQFELPLPSIGDIVPVDALETERARVRRLLHENGFRTANNPKANHLQSLLRSRNAMKTIVFTSATSTALDLANRLGWSSVAVVSGGNAWIASGRCRADDALDWFAPAARKRPRQHRRLKLKVLIATDIASEGLDLHDADAVVHYDIPWTPLRLAQRLGRVRRLGAKHRVAHVFWYAPPACLEERLCLRDRIEGKVETQIQTTVTTSSLVGESAIWSAQLESREDLANLSAATKHTRLGLSVVSGPLAVIAAIRWSTSVGSIPEVVALGGRHLNVLHDFQEVARLVERLRMADPINAQPPSRAMEAFIQLLRSRLRAAMLPAEGREARDLSREILSKAPAAHVNRNTETLDCLNEVLDRLGHGLPVGPERELATLLHSNAFASLRHWITEANYRVHPTDFTVEGVLFGDGTLTT